MSLADVAGGDDRLASLKALRDRIALELDITQSARDVSSLSQRFMDVIELITVAEKATPAQEGTRLDELRKRRADKAAATRPARASRAAK